eukprot:NODE_6869_length_1630_cov_6.937458.p1 GENE.NODE_6869_length_1630_cov_6.937458~~NODE_6869_length_1630_cov_6.937458.p1  ORF type:complete len:406 (-),score=132.15 NODE_6869_length_1630_cov_6.937458:300-1517(-)
MARAGELATAEPEAGAPHSAVAEPPEMHREEVALEERPYGAITDIIQVEVPIRVLGAEHCDAGAIVPEPLPMGTDVSWPGPIEEAVSIEVPEGSQPGCMFALDVAGERVRVPLPPLAAPGDTLMVVRRPNGTWRALKRATEFCYVVPDGPIERQQVLHLPDCMQIAYDVPPFVKPGHIISFKMSEDGTWVIEEIGTLSSGLRDAGVPPHLAGPYEGLLRVLSEHGYTKHRFPLDAAGRLHVCVPFCGGFWEYGLLGMHLESHLPLLGATGADVIATDIADRYSIRWAIAERWCVGDHPQIRVRTCVRDLAIDPLPEVGLCIAMHPEVTKGGIWFQIIGSLIKSTRRGVCAIATFFEHEMKTVCNMVEMYGSKGTSFEVLDNPYYDVHAPSKSPELRFIILVFGGG